MAATTPQISYATDWQWWDNTESVTASLTRRTTTTTVTISDAFRGDISRTAVDVLGADLVANSQIWSVPASLMGSNEFVQGDTITDADSVVWNVEGAVLVTLGSSKLYWTVATNKRKGS